MMKTIEMTGTIIQAAYEVYAELGPGLVEHLYETRLARAVEQRRLRVERQVPLAWRDSEGDTRCLKRLDLLVERTVIVEVKSVPRLSPAHLAQARTYLRLSGLQTALLINFSPSTPPAPAIRRVKAEIPSGGE